jgi:hypothetical protein
MVAEVIPLRVPKQVQLPQAFPVSLSLQWHSGCFPIIKWLNALEKSIAKDEKNWETPPWYLAFQ